MKMLFKIYLPLVRMINILFLKNQNDDDEFKIEESDVEENLIDHEEEVPEQKGEINPWRNRKLLTRNRLVYDIDSALDKSN